ncbi:hypothetical protein J3Q64DRAFT_1693709 [Phycomyces blakesleeanus]|uniref:Uncharacterized protein n=1 Tax=Phycomyces blakesleeanus TaxID=4837 RepID=A0ABR3BG45_PHYBL
MNPSKKSSAISSVVNDLIRAAAGGDAKSVADEDLDRYVADVILKEAEAKRKQYNQVGIRAYQPDTGLPPNRLPKPNKRFLLNVVKATDSHNQEVIRSNEEQAAQARRKRLREEEDRHNRSSRRHDRHNSIREERREERRERRQSRSPISRHSRSRTPPLETRFESPQPPEITDSIGNNPKEPLSNSNNLEKTPQRIKPVENVSFRGRGKINVGGSAMDKYFEDGYDPINDVLSDEEAFVFEPEKSKEEKKKKKKESGKKKKKKKKSKSKNKKRKTEEYSSDSSTDESLEKRPSIKHVRTWDIGKI